jgi:hypothetical protein
MARRYTRSNTPVTGLVADGIEPRDEDLMQALVTASAFVALALTFSICLLLPI